VEAEDKLAVWARPGRLSTRSVIHSESVFYGAFVCARRALNRPKLWFPARRAATCLVHYSLTIAKGY
jgi:hypothetical protein